MDDEKNYNYVIQLLIEVKESVAGLNTKMDNVNDKLENHEVRISTLEKDKLKVWDKIKNTFYSIVLPLFLTGGFIYLLYVGIQLLNKLQGVIK